MKNFSITNLEVFCGKPMFSSPKSTSNLVQPEFDRFISLVKSSFDKKIISNNGPIVQELEQRLAKLHGVENCISFCNGLWGIVLTMKALALKNRNEVIMPSMTYRRLADIAAWTNLVPRFCDIGPDLAVSLESVKNCINSDTALLLIAQPIVKVCDMYGLERLAKEHQIPIIFDSVEAGYATLEGRLIGTFGNAECFSMHASKLLNGFEAGYVTTNCSELAEKLRSLRAFGHHPEKGIVELGLNAKLNELHAALGVAAIEDLEDQLKRNRQRYKLYQGLLSEIEGIKLIEYDEKEVRSYKNILVRLNESWPYTRNETVELLNSDNLLARAYYYPPLHRKKTSYRTIGENLVNTEKLSEELLLLPSGEFILDEDIRMIVEYLKLIKTNSNEIKLRLEGNANG